MALSRRAVSVPGVWGPYFSAVLPGMWLLEGGQTAVGSLMDHLLQTHPAYEEAVIGKSRFMLLIILLLDKENAKFIGFLPRSMYFFFSCEFAHFHIHGNNLEVHCKKIQCLALAGLRLAVL